ncbi:MAG: family 10 glycosylhydrolase [Candidatus Sumerlaeales bacterium]|nr:family 10 glycosylhydrolase [Candidatus Sumerlaeales bacterium]
MKRNPFARVLLVLVAFISLSLLSTVICAQEYRMMWVSRFEWPNANATKGKNNIDNVMNTLAANNFNAVLFQVRGQCDVHYPSPYEPWSSNYNYTNPGWDPLQYALTAAHNKGLEFHAYINTHVISGSVLTRSTTPEHICNLHGPTAAGEDCWLIHDENGNPVYDSDEYLWISPGHPQASLWTRQQVMYLVKNYAVDGVHFDRIRCPSKTYSHDPVSVARFNGEGNPDGVSWGDFMRRQITDDLRRIYGQIAMVRPKCKVSAAPGGIILVDSTTQYQGTGNQAKWNWFQDGFRWLQEGVVDFMVPQIYWTVGSSHPYEKLLADWLSHSGGERFVVGGSTTNGGNRTVEQTLAEQQETRTQGAAGWCIFSYSSMGDYWNALRINRFASKASVPVMPWKATPTKGIITGYVTDADGNPLTDARIVLENDPLLNASGTAPYNHLTGADGFYAILNVPVSAAHKLTFSKNGKVSVTKTAVAVTAGKVTQVDCQFSSAVPDPDPATQIIVECRVASGELAGGYAETNSTAGYSFANTTAKSTAAGLVGTGGRYIGDYGVGASGSFTPNLTGDANYNVYLTLSNGTNNVSPGATWQILVDSVVKASGTIDLSYTNANIVNKWYKLTSIQLPKGRHTTLKVTNNNQSSAGTRGRFVMDSAKFEPDYPASIEYWEMF